MRVFIINASGHNFNKVYAVKGFKNAELIALTKGKVDVFNMDRNIYEFEKKLKTFDFSDKDDYIVISGSPILVSQFFIAIMKRQPKSLNLLLYNLREQRYKIRNVYMEEL